MPTRLQMLTWGLLAEIAVISFTRIASAEDARKTNRTNVAAPAPRFRR
jgi:hypothetical protein